MKRCGLISTGVVQFGDHRKRRRSRQCIIMFLGYHGGWVRGKCVGECLSVACNSMKIGDVVARDAY